MYVCYENTLSTYVLSYEFCWEFSDSKFKNKIERRPQLHLAYCSIVVPFIFGFCIFDRLFASQIIVPTGIGSGNYLLYVLKTSLYSISPVIILVVVVKVGLP